MRSLMPLVALRDAALATLHATAVVIQRKRRRVHGAADVTECAAADADVVVLIDDVFVEHALRCARSTTRTPGGIHRACGRVCVRRTWRSADRCGPAAFHLAACSRRRHQRIERDLVDAQLAQYRQVAVQISSVCPGRLKIMSTFSVGKRPCTAAMRASMTAPLPYFSSGPCLPAGRRRSSARRPRAASRRAAR